MQLLASMADNFAGVKDFQAQIISIGLTTIAICTIAIIYNIKIRGAEDGKKFSGFLLVMDSIIRYIETIVVSIMGKKFRKLTPYAMYIMFYILISSVFSLLGFEAAATSYTVTFSMGLVTFFAIYYFGFKYQKLSFFKKFHNPIEIFTQFTPLISISFRLFGNILGGSIILGLVYSVCIGLQGKLGGAVDSSFATNAGHRWINYDIFNTNKETWDQTWDAQYKYFWTGLNIFTTIITPALHLYFDLFDASIQSVVFTMLTFSYWAEAMGEEEEHEHHSLRETLKEKNLILTDKLNIKNKNTITL